MTTNYDDNLERALRVEHEPFDVLTYIAAPTHQGKFSHLAWGSSKAVVIHEPHTYNELPLNVRTIVLKIHGSVDRSDASSDSYVITENDYLNYLLRVDGERFLPATLSSELIQRNFLFLGYSMRDWNLRVVLERIWNERTLGYQSWSVQSDVKELDRLFWRLREVDVLDIELSEYLTGLEAALARRFPSRRS